MRIWQETLGLMFHVETHLKSKKTQKRCDPLTASDHNKSSLSWMEAPGVPGPCNRQGSPAGKSCWALKIARHGVPICPMHPFQEWSQRVLIDIILIISCPCQCLRLKCINSHHLSTSCADTLAWSPLPVCCTWRHSGGFLKAGSVLAERLGTILCVSFQWNSNSTARLWSKCALAARLCYNFGDVCCIY